MTDKPSSGEGDEVTFTLEKRGREKERKKI